MTIPLKNLNCLHCHLFKDGRCDVTGEKVPNPQKHYCFRIFKNYKENGQ